MEFNREQIIKALECCITPRDCDCDECPLDKYGSLNCKWLLMSHSLSLIKELTEENERLREDNEIKSQKRANIFEITNAFERGRTDGVRKYKSAIIEYYSKPKYQPTKEHPIKHTQIEHLLAVLAEKEKELLEAKP